LREPSYFLYIVGVPQPKRIFARQWGDCGVGRTDLGPGIMDAPWGTMLVVSAEYMFKVSKSRYPGAETIKYYILKYYGK